MKLRGRNIAFVLAAPVMAVGLLAGMAAEQRTYVTPADVEPYHARAKAAIEQVPWVITGNGGFWTGKDDEVPIAAQKLLRPNHILSRTYVDKQTDAWGPRVASLLIVQCRDSRDMLGHYPPRCYPSHGMTMALDTDRDWTIGDLVITGKEYHFTRDLQGQTHRTTVYNFFVVPAKAPDGGGGRAPAVADAIKRDMDAVRDAAEDYQQRYYGAAQFQVVFNGLSSADLPKGERDEIFATLIEPCLPVIKALASTAVGDAPPAPAPAVAASDHSFSSVSSQRSETAFAYPPGELK
jgi:hypothetical protein